jgi:pimeloyl-ACP methyl ester carboxylesterase
MTTLDIKRPAATSTTQAGELERPGWLPIAQWPFRLRHLPYRRPDGEVLDIHYTDEGSGPTLVLVHAGMWSFIWRDAIARLRDDFRCVTLDFPAAGLSGGDRHDVDLTTYPAIVNALLDRLGIGRATFVVHDLGGVVGIIAATDRAERFAGLAATNSFAWPPEGRALRTMLAIVGSRAATATLGTFRLVPRLTRGKAGVGLHYDKADRAAFFGPYQRRAAARNFHRAMRSVRRSRELYADAERRLMSSPTDLPVLTVFGEKNDPFGFADRWRSMFPHARSWTVPAGNHFPMCDDPDGYAARLRDWHRTEVAS